MRSAPRSTHSSEDPSNAAGFDEFFDSELPGLLRFCWGLTVDADRARDLAQEAMARVFADWVRIATGNPAGWVRTVALNLHRTQWRSDRRKQSALRRLRAERPESIPAVSGMSAAVADALRSLSQRQREAVVLHHMVDLSVAEVAEIMQVGVPSVKTHLQRGRSTLAGLLDEDLEESDD